MILTVDDIAYIRLEINDLDSRIFTDDDLQIIAEKHTDMNLLIADLLELIITKADYWQNFNAGDLQYNPNSAIIQQIKNKIERLRSDIQTEYIKYYTEEDIPE
jgi:hypothetical protein